VQQDLRPERPDHEDAPQLSDGVWELTENCWVKNPASRPTASAVCDILSHLLDPLSVARPAPVIPILRQENRSQALTPPSLELKGHTDHVICVTFSPDGKHILSGSNDRTIRIWNAQTGITVLEPLRMHTSGVLSVAFSPDGTRFASGATDMVVLLWDAITGRVVARPFKGHTNSILSLGFSPDGKRMVTGSADETIRIWDAEKEVDNVTALMGHTGHVTCAMFTPDGKRIVSGSDDNTVRIWDTNSCRLIHGPLRVDRQGAHFVGFSPNGKTIVSAGWGGNVCVWATETGALLSGPSHRHEEGSLAVTFMATSTVSSVSPDGNWIAGIVGREEETPGIGHSVQVWNSKTGLLATKFQTHNELVQAISFSPDSKHILFSTDFTVHVRNIEC
jgi:WD40 repeat protein